ncbi:MAG: hypothetical protein NW223_17545 [Hyphomicrobiaceae bacterium]|nr:hypothetical protein [Hyphomicrobiaceae bacterium]
MSPAPSRHLIRTAVLAAASLGLADVAARAGTQINTGGESGAYHASFCPALSRELKVAQLDYPCVTSAGTRENIERVLGDPRQLGYAQLDAYVIETQRLKAGAALSLVRQDDVRECVFAVTRNKSLATYGDIASNAERLRFILPPADSGSASTFNFLRSVDSQGLAKARSVSNATSTDEALQQALASDDTVSLFVQFPDPDNARFALIRKLGGHIVPVIDREILRQEAGGRKIYFAQETQVENADWIKSGRKVVTACTPLVVFTGAPDLVKPEPARRDHEDMMRTVAAIKPASLLPQESMFRRLLKRTRELSAISTEKLLELSDEARQKAKPYTEKAGEAMKETADQAKQAAERAAEAAKPYMEKGKEAAKKAYDDALKAGKEIMDKAKKE